jgi:multiple sugar transport system permease protein
MKRRKKWLRALAYLTACALSVLFLMPFVWMLRSSLTELSQIFETPPRWIPDPVRWENYTEALTFVPFGRYFLNSTLIVVGCLSGILLTSSLAAFSFSRIRWPGRNIVFGILLSSMMLPGAVTLIPTFIGWQSLGFYNTYAPLIVPSWFGGGAYNIFLLRQFYMGIPRALDEAAFVDGAGYFRIYWNVVLPLSRSAMIVVGLFAFMFHWNDFFGPLIYLKDEHLYTLALGLQQFQGSYMSEWGLLMAASTVVILPCVIVFLIGQKSFIQGITLTGLKG